MHIKSSEGDNQLKSPDNSSFEKLPEPPQQLLELALSWQMSKVLFALVEFKIPDLLAERKRTKQEIAAVLGLHPLACDRFLHACAALKLLSQAGEYFSNTPLSETFLTSDKQSYLGDQFLNYDRTSYPLWADLTTKLREWYPGKNAHQTPQDEDQGAESMLAQHNLALLAGNALAEAYDFSAHQQMLDLGGGTGAMSISICARHPQLQSTVYDLSPVTQAAELKVTEAGLRERIKLQAGDLRKDELPSGFDVVLLANLLSTTSESTARTLLQRLHDQLPAGGAVLLSGWILENSRTTPLLPVLFCLEDINWEVPDVEHTVSTYVRWLEEAGFHSIQYTPYAAPYSLIRAYR
jgi:3-hydroxy-5-methyl-1-naphthoate 3-O-methyltransferase